MNAILTPAQHPDLTALDLAIDTCGGHNKFAFALGVRPPAVSQWKAAGRVPLDRCADIVRVTHGIVSLEGLAEMCPELEKILTVLRARSRTRTHARRGGQPLAGSKTRSMIPIQGDLAMT